MQWMLDAVYGPNAASDPYYQFFVDAQALIPWWYPILVFGIAATIVTYKVASKMQYRRRTVLAANRVERRTRRRSYQVVR